MLDDLYSLLDALRKKTNGPFTLGECHGRMNWPRRGLYFFFEPGEKRLIGAPRVTRVGTHALREASRSTVWGRLRQHKGTGAGGGHHRGSIFRLHIGAALIARNAKTADFSEWGRGSSAPKITRLSEEPLESEVSAYIRSMPFLVLGVDGAPASTEDRGFLEKNTLRILAGAEPPSPAWLGRDAQREVIQSSGLWNVASLRGTPDRAVLERLDVYVSRAEPIG